MVRNLTRQTLNHLNPEMLRLYEENYCIHDYQNLQKAINLLEDMRTQQEDDLPYPTAHTVNLVLYGLANCKPCQANAEQAERILTQMVNDCEQQQKNGLKNACYGPDSKTHSDKSSRHGQRAVVQTWQQKMVVVSSIE